MSRKIAVLTGSRADYGIYRPLLHELTSRPQLEVMLIVTGMHLAEEFGATCRDIEVDGYQIAAKVDMLLRADSRGAMAKSLGIALIGITQALEEMKPDLLILLGDRGEMLAGAIAGAHLGLVVIHIHGGELSGSIDDSIRHAITKFAQLHFPVTQHAANVLMASGETAERIIVAGAPGLDDLSQGYDVSFEELETSLGFRLERPYILIVFHPVVGEERQSQKEFGALLQALARVKKESILLLPNSDAGRAILIRTLEDRPLITGLHILPHLPRRLYLGLMANAQVMIGNSSSGIIEAPGFGLPVINLGSRQRNRLRGENVVDISVADPKEIEGVLRRFLDGSNLRQPGVNPYFGGASKIITDTLVNLPLERYLSPKTFSFDN